MVFICVSEEGSRIAPPRPLEAILAPLTAGPRQGSGPGRVTGRGYRTTQGPAGLGGGRSLDNSPLTRTRCGGVTDCTGRSWNRTGPEAP